MIRESRGDRKKSETLDYLMRTLGTPAPLSRKEEKRLGRLGDAESRWKIAKHNNRLAIRIAKSFVGYGVALEDLALAGVVGNLKAAKRYDPNFPGRFISYSSSWIIRECQGAVDDFGGAMRLPVNQRLRLTKARKIAGRDGISVADALETVGGSGSKEPGINRDVLAASYGVVSLDAPVKTPSGKSGEISELIRDPNGMARHREVENDLLRLDLERIMGEALSAKERDIVRRWYGWDGEPETMDEIKVDYGLSRERVRQIREGAQKKMREYIEKREAA